MIPLMALHMPMKTSKNYPHSLFLHLPLTLASVADKSLNGASRSPVRALIVSLKDRVDCRLWEFSRLSFVTSLLI